MNPEAAEYLNMLEDLRGQIIRLLEELPAEALNWRPIEGEDDHVTNSVAVMAAHVAGAEHYWVGEVVGGLPASRDRPAEFKTKIDSPAPLINRLAEVGEESQLIIANLTADELNKVRVTNHGEVSTRWALLHAIDHTALHLGHMQITAQLWRGGETAYSPRWFQRLNPNE